ncbi:MAG: helix-turn-helix transcriptional regulator [Polyangiaceae bacterium]|nr:helix-turn-helix transcriptional regulator [Polyangiaceae bacterium]
MSRWAPCMLSLTHTPSSRLAPFVERLWMLGDAPPHARECIVPTGTVELVVNLHDDRIDIYDSCDAEQPRRYSGAVVSGVYGRSFVIDTTSHASIVGVHFKPGGAYPFFGVRTDELADDHVDLDALWGRTARTLRDRLCEVTSPIERFRILEGALLSHLAARVHPREAVRDAVASLVRGATAVADIAERAGVSHRHFIDVFSAEVGMAPKLFSRVQRFQRAKSMLERGAEPRFSQVALASGYCDQSHLIRDFVALSGLTPLEHVRRRNDRVKVDHVALF